MADSLLDLLSHKSFEEPPEAQAIKAYIKRAFRESAEVVIRERDILITVTNASLASTLRFHVGQLRHATGSGKRLIFRVR